MRIHSTWMSTIECRPSNRQSIGYNCWGTAMTSSDKFIGSLNAIILRPDTATGNASSCRSFGKSMIKKSPMRRDMSQGTDFHVSSTPHKPSIIPDAKSTPTGCGRDAPALLHGSIRA